MRIRLLLFFFVSLLWTGCKKDSLPEESLSLSGTAYHFDQENHTQIIEITSDADWQITGGNDWCSPDRTRGNGDQRLTVTVGANTEQAARKNVLTVKNNYTSINIHISQDAYWGSSAGNLSGYRYKLPVVFHILYNDASDPNQNIDGQRLKNALEKCNVLYNDSDISQDMNLEFVPATTDPDGRELEEPGINRIEWPASIRMSASRFMDDKTYGNLVWDQDNYINVVVFTFTESGVMGVSHLPYTTGTSMLAGLNDGTVYLNRKPTYPHCVAVNNAYAYSTNAWLNESDFVLTLEHELGHYLGLFHTFSENTCVDNDYCDDTPTYDRELYNTWYAAAGRVTLEEGAQRMNCNGDKFVSNNVMDYDISYLNYFSPRQRVRVRHVLENSPLIPGPKANRTKGVLNIDGMEIPESRWIE